MTNKLYYENPYQKEFEATVVSCEKKGDKWIVVLDRTCFYPEGGGQPADHGKLTVCGSQERESQAIGNTKKSDESMSDGLRQINVVDVHESEGDILHTVESEVAPGTKVTGEIDWERRFDHMQQHSGEHIISGMLCSKFHCNNVGFHMGAEIIQIDYDADITWEEVLETERQANAYIRENHEISISWPSKEELASLEYRSKKELTGAVRITEWPVADICACCGTHVRTSSEVGLVKTLSVQKIKEGVRIELLCGKRAYDYLSAIWDQNQEISRALSAKPAATADAVLKLKEENFRLKSQCTGMEEKIFSNIAEEYKGQKDPVIFIDGLTSDGVRRLCDMVSETASGRCIVFSGADGEYKYAVIHKGNDIKDFIINMNKALGGRGGGKNGFAQGNLTSNKAEIMEFLTKMTNIE